MRVNLDGKGYFRSDDKFAAFKVARAVSELMTAAGLKHKKDSYCRRPIVVMCIGTDRSTGDSLGPLVGDIVKVRVLDVDLKRKRISLSMKNM